MSTRNISPVKAAGGRFTTLPLSCAICLEIWKSQLLEPSGPVQTCTGIALEIELDGKGASDCATSSAVLGLKGQRKCVIFIL